MLISFFRTVILYLALMAGMRMLGKRQIGQLEPSEFVVAMLIADLAAIPMQNGGIPLVSGLVPLLTVLSLELSLTGLTMVSPRFRRLVCGKPVILIDNGKLLRRNLRAARITLDELSSHLRQKDVLDIAAVQFAILETDGNLSVFPYPSQVPASAGDAGVKVGRQYLPITIIEDGYLSRENLKKAGKTETWLETVLSQRKTTLSDTFLLTVDASDHIHWVAKEEHT